MLYDDILDGVLEEEGLGKATKKSSIQLASSDEKISKKGKITSPLNIAIFPFL